MVVTYDCFSHIQWSMVQMTPLTNDPLPYMTTFSSTDFFHMLSNLNEQPPGWCDQKTHILPCTNDHITNWQNILQDNDIRLLKEKTQLSRQWPRLSDPGDCRTPTRWKLWYSKWPAVIISMFCYCFGTGKLLLNRIYEKFTCTKILCPHISRSKMFIILI